MTERQGERARVNGRFRALRGAMILAGIVLAARVVHIQIVQHEKFGARAKSQWGQEVATNAERGNLYDRHGRPLALSVTTWQIGVAKGLVDDRDALCTVLAEVLEMPATEIRRRIAGTRSRHAVLARDVVLSAEQKRRLQRDGQGAVTLDPNYARVYPTDGVGASLVGTYRPDPQRDVMTGLECALNDRLAGKPGRARELHTAVSTRQLGRVVLEEEVHGQSIVLTVDADLQAICENELAAAVADYRAAGGSVLIMDPSNGDVLAAASWPLMDTRRRSHADAAVWKNRNFTDMFEPGSVFKIFSTASLLRNAAIDTQTVYNCDNNSGEKIYVRNDGGHDYGPLSLMRAFAKSSNVYFAKASANLRPQELYRDLTNFGFGQEPALPYPGLAGGILHSPVDWSGRSQQTIAIGQEVAVTSLQLGMALCSVANGGTLFVPRLVREIRDDRGRVVETLAPVGMRQVMSPALAALLREAMARVVKEGTGDGARQDWISVGGKTGTAQKSRDGKTYTTGAYVASFGGFVPVDDPRLVILTVLDEPRGSFHYAAQSAVPLFRSVVCDIRRSTDWLTDVPGGRTAPFSGPDELRLVTVPDVLYLSVANAAQRLAGQDLAVSGAEKDGLVVEQVPAAGSRCEPGTVVRVTVADEVATVGRSPAPGLCPDFQGLSNRQIRSLAARLDIPVSIRGVGYAVRQSVQPGQAWDHGGVTVVMQGSRF